MKHLILTALSLLVPQLLSAQYLTGQGLTPPNKLELIISYQDALVAAAKSYAEMDHVPYVWGGSKIGSPEDCQACRSCVAEKQVSLTRRMARCAPCRRCGMDCSHFVSRVFSDVGLTYGYASSRELGRQSQAGLIANYGFVDVGTDISLAQPGDVLIYPKHVAMLIQANSTTHGDIIHSTRFRAGDHLSLGGIRYDKNINLKKYRGRLIRIIRHYSLFKNPPEFKSSQNRAPVS
jgi:cell wall-associated NlpC family hydrolase